MHKRLVKVYSNRKDISLEYTMAAVQLRRREETEQLAQCVRRGDVDGAKACIDAGVRAGSFTNNDDDIDTVREASSQGALYRGTRRPKRVKVIDVAVANGDMQMVRMLAQKGALQKDVIGDTYNNTLSMHLAIDMGDLTMVQLLSDYGMEPYALYHGQTALDTACHTGRVSIVKWLLQDLGLSAGSSCFDPGSTPLARLIRRGDPTLEIVQLLLAYGATAFEHVAVHDGGQQEQRFHPILYAVRELHTPPAVVSILLQSTRGTVPTEYWMDAFEYLVETGEPRDIFDAIAAQRKLTPYNVQRIRDIRNKARGVPATSLAEIDRGLFHAKQDPRGTLVSFRSRSRPPILAARRAAAQYRMPQDVAGAPPAAQGASTTNALIPWGTRQ